MKRSLRLLFPVASIPLVSVGGFTPEIGQRRSASPPAPKPPATIPTNTALSYANDPSEPMELPFNPLLDNGALIEPDTLAPTNTSKRDQNWRARYNELVAYQQRFGNADVPLNWPENKSLATWVINQRRKYRNDSLKQYQVDLLNAIDFTWDRQKSWNERFAELEEFKKLHGTFIIHSNDEKHKELYVWCCNQRQQYRQLMELGSSSLTSERVSLLKSIGFLGQSASVQKNSWNERLEELKEYKRQYGHTNVPRRYNRNHKLGRWVDTQRTSYRLLKLGKSSPLTQDRIDMLNDIGFEWNPSATKDNCSTAKSSKTAKTKYTPWQVRYEELQIFKAQYGHVLVDHKTRLGEWVRVQRRQYNLLMKGAKSSLTSTRLALLKELGVFDYQPALGGSGTQASAVPSAPFIRLGMSDEEKFEAWRARFAIFDDMHGK